MRSRALFITDIGRQSNKFKKEHEETKSVIERDELDEDVEEEKENIQEEINQYKGD